MSNSPQLPRRLLLGGLGAGVASLAVGSSTSAWASPSRSGTAQRWPSARSANGWPIGGPTRTHRVEGSSLNLTLTDGAAATLLIHAARRINYELDTLRPGDLVGLTHDRQVASATRSNLLSGTAILFRPGSFPLGTDDNLFPNQVVIFEDIVAEASGALMWGGHLATPDQGLIYIAPAPGSTSVTKTARTFEREDSISTSSGAGAIDAFQTDRRRTAKTFARERRR